MPGASVLAVNGDEIEGQVKVKLGPLSLTYKGTAKFADKDQANQTITIEASGKEARCAGTASATVQADLRPADAGGSTLVAIHTLLNVAGRPAQFGRPLLPEVSGKLIAQFAANLEAMITADNAGAESEKSGASEAAVEAAVEAAASEQAMAVGGTVNVAASQPAAPVVKQEESLNAFKFVVVPILKRVLPVAAVGAAIAVIFRRLRSRKS